METERPWSTRAAHLFPAILVAACSIYDPSLLSSVGSSSSGGEVGTETGGLPGKSELTGGTTSKGGAASSSGGTSRGGSTGGTIASASGGSANASGGSIAQGGTIANGGSGGSGLSGGATSGGVMSLQGGSSTGGKSGTGGTSTGGASTGGASTGGASTGGASTGGKSSTGGTSTGGASTGGSAGAGGSSCAGKVFQGLCWYLGPVGQSCDATCAAYGGVAMGSEAFVGTTAQGGSLTECQQILALLGVSAAPILASRDDVGLGCHLYDADPYWLSAPDFTTDASVPEARLVCACR